MSKQIIVQLATPERYYTKCYHDFIDCKLLNGEEKIIFLSLKRFMDVKADNGNVFPTIEAIQEITGWGNQKVVKYIKSLCKKGAVKKIRQGLSKPNIYVIADYSTMWESETVEDLAAVVQNEGRKPMTAAEHIAELERMGYKVNLTKENESASGSWQTTDADPQKAYLFTEKDNTGAATSQARKYDLEQIKTIYGYGSLVNRYPDKQADLDIVIDILFDTLNTEKEKIRISGEDKPAEVVVARQLKLLPEDLIFTIDQFHGQRQRIKNVKAYVLTILYNSHGQNRLDLMNLGHSNGDF